MLKSAGRDISSANRSVRIPLALRISLRIRPIRTRRKILRSVGEKKALKTSESPIPWKGKTPQRKCSQALAAELPIYAHFAPFCSVGVESSINHITSLSTKTLPSTLQLLTGELRKRKANCNIFKEAPRLYVAWKLHSFR